jgi:hypothetical protein
VDHLIRDARYALRVLRRAPFFAAAAILSLALGIGANAAIFQLIDTVRIRSLPVADPQGLVEVRADGVHGFGISTSFNSGVRHPLWEQMRANQTAFTSIFAWGSAQFLVGRGDDVRQARGLWLSGDFFRVLGITPARGRLLTTDDDRRGCGAGAAIVSPAFWQAFLGGRDSAIGSTLAVFDQPFTIVGVTPARFTGLEVGQAFDVALPVCSAALWGDSLDRRDFWWLTVMGRLKPDWTIARANEYVRALSPGLLDVTVPSGYGADLTAQYRAFRFGVFPARVITTLVGFGSHGPDVLVLQQRLKQIGLPVIVDGGFGVDTKNALAKFQQSHGLSPTGHLSEKTLQALGITFHLNIVVHDKRKWAIETAVQRESNDPWALQSATLLCKSRWPAFLRTW